MCRLLFFKVKYSKKNDNKIRKKVSHSWIGKRFMPWGANEFFGKTTLKYPQ